MHFYAMLLGHCSRAPSLIPELWWLQRNVLLLQPLVWGPILSVIYILIYMYVYI